MWIFRKPIWACVIQIGEFDHKIRDLVYLRDLIEELQFHVNNPPQEVVVFFEAQTTNIEVFYQWLEIAYFLNLDVALDELNKIKLKEGEIFIKERIKRDVKKIKKEIEKLLFKS